MFGHTVRSLYSVSGDGWYRKRVWRFIQLNKRTEQQKWSPNHYEEVTTWSVGIGWWHVAVQRRTKHFSDNGWIAE